MGGRSYVIFLWKSSVEYILYQTSAGLGGGLVTVFCDLLYSLRLRPGGEDIYVGSHTKGESLKKGRSIMGNPYCVGSSLPWNSVWRVKAPSIRLYTPLLHTFNKIELFIKKTMFYIYIYIKECFWQ